MVKGLSVEEKRTKLLEIFHETKDFYQIKELEKLGQKKGIVSQTVKEVLQTLVDDNLVDFDKIGSANFYWSFPSARGATLTHKMKTANEELATLEARQVELNAAITASKAEREDTPSRAEMLAKYSKMQQKLASVKVELQQYECTNPEAVEEKLRAVVLAREAAHRWTDNVDFSISHIISTFSLDPTDVRKHFGIPDNFDDLPAD